MDHPASPRPDSKKAEVDCNRRFWYRMNESNVGYSHIARITIRHCAYLEAYQRMAKIGIKSSEVTNFLNNNTYGGWTLCIGAGASIPLFPTWQHLVQKLLISGPTAVSVKEAEKLRQSFPPE